MTPKHYEAFSDAAGQKRGFPWKLHARSGTITVGVWLCIVLIIPTFSYGPSEQPVFHFIVGA